MEIKYFDNDFTRLKLVKKKSETHKKIINIGVVIPGKKPIIIAGPCSIEDENQAFTIAENVIKCGADIFRGGAFKPRTSPYDFQGLGEKGLEILAKIRKKFDIPVITEAIDVNHLKIVAEYVDIIQIGARNMFNYPLLKEAGKINKPILLKRGNNATVYEFLSAAEYILSEGDQNVILCERGIRTFEKITRNTLDLSIVPLLKKITHFPVFVDPSHATGIRELVIPMSLAAIVAGSDGIVVEVHNEPEKAKSDPMQQLNFDEFKELMNKINKLNEVFKTF